MRTSIVVCALLTLGSPLCAAESAHVSLFCNSLRFFPATANSSTLSLTTDSSFQEFNGELAPIGDPSLPGYGALFQMDDASTATSLRGQIFFNTPPPVDTNGNGFDDFQEVSQAVPSTQTQGGEYNTAVDSGTVTAVWSRPAGQSQGTCTVQMTSSSFGELPSFSFTFELITYQGTLSYTPGSNFVSGSLSVTNLENATNWLAGAVRFTRASGNDRFNDLTWLSGTLTNEAGQAVNYKSVDIQRDTNLKTNYYGFPLFSDGDPSTSTPDFQSWTVSIDDRNDSDQNGIPDFSDDPAAVSATPPNLTLSLGNKQLLLGITADVGQSFILEYKDLLSQTNWSQGDSITMTNGLQTVPLPIPYPAQRYWRLRTP